MPAPRRPTGLKPLDRSARPWRTPFAHRPTPGGPQPGGRNRSARDRSRPQPHFSRRPSPARRQPSYPARGATPHAAGTPAVRRVRPVVDHGWIRGHDRSIRQLVHDQPGMRASAGETGSKGCGGKALMQGRRAYALNDWPSFGARGPSAAAESRRLGPRVTRPRAACGRRSMSGVPDKIRCSTSGNLPACRPDPLHPIMKNRRSARSGAAGLGDTPVESQTCRTRS